MSRFTLLSTNDLPALHKVSLLTKPLSLTAATSSTTSSRLSRIIVLTSMVVLCELTLLLSSLVQADHFHFFFRWKQGEPSPLPGRNHQDRSFCHPFTCRSLSPCLRNRVVTRRRERRIWRMDFLGNRAIKGKLFLLLHAGDRLKS